MRVCCGIYPGAAAEPLCLWRERRCDARGHRTHSASPRTIPIDGNKRTAFVACELFPHRQRPRSCGVRTKNGSDDVKSSPPAKSVKLSSLRCCAKRCSDANNERWRRNSIAASPPELDHRNNSSFRDIRQWNPLIEPRNPNAAGKRQSDQYRATNSAVPGPHSTPLSLVYLKATSPPAASNFEYSTFPPVFQPERRAAIVEQVELHIAPALHELFFAILRFAPRCH